MNDRTALANLVEPVDANQARLIGDPKTQVSRLPTPFLQRGLIFRFDWRGPYKIVSGTIGYARASNAVFFLAASPQNFDALVAAAGVVLETEEQRVSYAVTRLETTRRFDETFVVLNSVEDLSLMGGASPEAVARAQALKKTYAARIKPPQAEPAGPGWTVPVYVLSVNDLCLFTVAIAADGSSKQSRTVLEANTPMLPR